MVGVPPSGSVAVAVQVRVSPPCAVEGETEISVMMGSVPSTSDDAESVAVPPSASVAVTVQVMVSPGSSADVTVYVVPITLHTDVLSQAGMVYVAPVAPRAAVLLSSHEYVKVPMPSSSARAEVTAVKTASS